jgi:hypothetical protein
MTDDSRIKWGLWGHSRWQYEVRQTSPIQSDVGIGPLLRLRSDKGLVAQVGNTRQQLYNYHGLVSDTVGCVAFCSVLLGSQGLRAGAGLFSSAFVRSPLGGRSERKEGSGMGLRFPIGASAESFRWDEIVGWVLQLRRCGAVLC